MRPTKTWIVTIVVDDTPESDDAYYVKNEIIKLFDKLDLDSGLQLAEVTAEEQ